MNNDINAVTKFSFFFIKQWRISVLLLAGILGIGFFTYSKVLKRESMPPIDIPAGMIVTPYFVNNKDIVNTTITVPLEKTLTQLPEISQITSSTSDNVSTITVSFNEEITSKDGIQIVKEAINSANGIPKEAVHNYITFDAGKIDNTHDLLFSISSEGKSIQELQEKAASIAKELELNSNISKAEVIKVITEDINPLTGQTIEHPSIISRIGYKKGDELIFSQAVYIGINKKNNKIGSIELSKAVNDEIETIKTQGGLDRFETTFSVGDPAIALNKQINDLQKNALEAFFIVLVVIFFIINWRASLVTIVFIPTVLAATYVGFNLIHYSINTMTLFALVLVLGLFVDDAIVVVEAIDAQKQSGNKGLSGVARAIKKVGIADITGTVTTMLVFVPMAMISGIMGDFIKIMPITVILALGLSLVIALSIIPFLSSKLIAEKSDDKKANIVQKINKVLFLPGQLFTKAGVLVSRFVNYYLGKPVLSIFIVIISLVLIGIGASYASQLPFSIFPPPKDGDNFAIRINYPEGTTLNTAEEVAKDVEQISKTNFSQEITNVSYFSSDEKGALLFYELTPMDQRHITARKIVDTLNTEFAQFKKANATIKAAQLSAGPLPDEYPFKMQIFVEDPVVLKNTAESVKEHLLQTKVTNDVKVEDVHIQNIEVIGKKNGRRYVQIEAKLTESENQSGDLQSLIAKMKDYYTKDKLAEMNLGDKSIEYDLGMETEMMKSFNSAVVGIFIALIVMYALLILQFNSFTKPFLVFLGIPFSFILLFPGLKFLDIPMSFFVIIGITALTGILANNIIMLLDFARIRQIEENKNPREAIVGAIKRRFRPLCATSIITISGLLPLALNDPFWAPLAYTIILGLLACTTMVILVLPLYFVIVENCRQFVKGKIKRIGK